jgi:hypothetical protein
MTYDAAIFTSQEVTLADLGRLFLASYPDGECQTASLSSVQLIAAAGSKDYIEVADSSLAVGSKAIMNFGRIWEQAGDPPDEAIYCALPGFFTKLGQQPKHFSLWGRSKEYVEAVLEVLSFDERIWVMMYNGKIVTGAVLRQHIRSKAFFDPNLPW